MTLKEAILEDLKPYPIREKLVEKKCVDYALNPNKEYDVSDSLDSKRVQLDVLKQYMMLSSSTQGGSRLVFRGLRDRIKMLSTELGLSVEGMVPTVKYLNL